MLLRHFALCCVLALVGFAPVSVFADPLPGTQPLTIDQPLDVLMVDGIDKFALREIAESVAKRAAYWKQDFSSPAAYEKSIAPNRARFLANIGAVDARVPASGIELIATATQSAVVAQGKSYTVLAVRWPVLAGVTAEGLLLNPTKKPVARVIAIPDADWTPEMLAGVAPGVDAKSQFARKLAEQGCQVLVPLLINRDDTFSGNPEIRMTNQAHREYVYRPAFEMGRHIIGYEVQKVLAGVDEFVLLNEQEKSGLPIGVIGAGEGGLLALYSGAADPRISTVVVSGYFQPRENVWQEPIYRNVWGLLKEFGDAELAGMIAPRTLIVEAAAAPEVAGPHAPKPGRGVGAAPGAIVTPALANVKAEFTRATENYKKLKSEDRLQLVVSGEGAGPAGSDAALAALLKSSGVATQLKDVTSENLADARTGFDPVQRQKRQLAELMDFTQALVRVSDKVRDKLWSKAKISSVDDWVKTAAPYRDLVYEEMIGKLPEPTMSPNVRTRQVLDTPEYRGYEVVIDVYPDVIADGILLMPKDIKPGEKRPVVVCQHGLEGVPMDTIVGPEGDGHKYYKGFTSDLAKAGFITYAPQNPYRGKDRFRTLQRKSNPLQRSLYTYIIPQHKRTIEFLATLPNVDAKRIGFYGLSYGGKTAMRVPTMLEGYCLSICSGDFNEWVVKNTTLTSSGSYVFTGEYEIWEWNLGHVANYAELSKLMTPRPFMVERGHFDGCALDEWVGWEFAKVRRHYDLVGLSDLTEMETFSGPHTINGKGTYDFLHKHLKWPKRSITAASK